MIAVDLEKVLLAACQGCNEEFSEEPCEPGCCRIRAKIEKLPRLTLDDLRPKGRWIMRGGKRYCSHCGERACVTRDKEDFWYTTSTKFCSECGADMRGGDK